MEEAERSVGSMNIFQDVPQRRTANKEEWNNLMKNYNQGLESLEKQIKNIKMREYAAQLDKDILDKVNKRSVETQDMVEDKVKVKTLAKSIEQDRRNVAEFKEALRENIVNSLEGQIKEKKGFKQGRDSGAHYSSSSGIANANEAQKGPVQPTNNALQRNLKKKEDTFEKSSKIQPKTPADWNEYVHLGKKEIIRPVYYNVNKSAPEQKINENANELKGNQQGNDHFQGYDQAADMNYPIKLHQTPKRPPSDYEKEAMNFLKYREENQKHVTEQHREKVLLPQIEKQVEEELFTNNGIQKYSKEVYDNQVSHYELKKKVYVEADAENRRILDEKKKKIDEDKELRRKITEKSVKDIEILKERLKFEKEKKVYLQNQYKESLDRQSIEKKELDSIRKKLKNPEQAITPKDVQLLRESIKLPTSIPGYSLQMGGLDSITAQHLISKAANELKGNKSYAITPNSKGVIKTPYLMPNTPGNNRNALSQSALHTLSTNNIGPNDDPRLESLEVRHKTGSKGLLRTPLGGGDEQVVGNNIAFINEGDHNPVVDVGRQSAKSEKSLQTQKNPVIENLGSQTKDYNKIVEKYILDELHKPQPGYDKSRQTDHKGLSVRPSAGKPERDSKTLEKVLSYGHNPITNPIPYNQQNPYVIKQYQNLMAQRKI